MTVCDLCEQAKECSERTIEGRVYDICPDCWNALIEKLRGKGRTKKEREYVLLPEPEPAAPEAPQPWPGKPPDIRGAAA